MLLLMASTVSFHSDSFIARIDVIFPFVVAWKRVSKVDNGSLEAARRDHSSSVHALVFATSRFPRLSENLSGLRNCFTC